jgi:signal transduction histidine kinase/HAMP domain-containing protein
MRAMPRIPARLLGMRWWLALAFAAVAGLTAVAVVGVLNARSERAVRAYAQEFAVGNAVAASETVRRDRSLEALRREIGALARRRQIGLFAFDAEGRLLTGDSSDGHAYVGVPMREQALRSALRNDRFIRASSTGSALVVGLPISGGGPAAALVAYSYRPELAEHLGIVQNQYLAAALLALAVGAAAGLVIASLIAYRLARIARAAHAIGTGDFSVVASDRFPDEVGSLARSLDRMRAQLQSLVRALQDDRDRLERLLDRLNDGVLLLDRSLTIEFANGQAHELLGDGDLLLGRRLAGVPRGALLAGFASDLFSLGLPGQLLLAVDEQMLLVSGIPPGATGENAIVVIADQSRRERTERAQREFATNAAHELRTPLSSIVSAIELLQTGGKDDPATRDRFLDLIEREAARLSRLTRALLVLARAEAREESPRLEAVDLRSLLLAVADGLPMAEGVAVTVECPDGLAALGDAELLEQALSSLGANAVQYTRAGAVILRATGDGIGSAVIEVVDTGSGISPHDRRRIFDRFYRGENGDEQGGFGLGLSIALGAVRALGGQIELESEPGLGTTVRIVLAAAGREAVA